MLLHVDGVFTMTADFMHKKLKKAFKLSVMISSQRTCVVARVLSASRSFQNTHRQKSIYFKLICQRIHLSQQILTEHWLLFCERKPQSIVVQTRRLFKETGEMQKPGCLPNAETKQTPKHKHKPNATKGRHPQNKVKHHAFRKMEFSHLSVPLHDDTAIPASERSSSIHPSH